MVVTKCIYIINVIGVSRGRGGDRVDDVCTIVIDRVSWVRRGRFSDIFIALGGGIKFNGSNKFYNNDNKYEGDANGKDTIVYVISVNNSSVIIVILTSIRGSNYNVINR